MSICPSPFSAPLLDDQGLFLSVNFSPDLQQMSKDLISSRQPLLCSSHQLNIKPTDHRNAEWAQQCQTKAYSPRSTRLLLTQKQNCFCLVWRDSPKRCCRAWTDVLKIPFAQVDLLNSVSSPPHVLSEEGLPFATIILEGSPLTSEGLLKFRFVSGMLSKTLPLSFCVSFFQAWQQPLCWWQSLLLAFINYS